MPLHDLGAALLVLGFIPVVLSVSLPQKLRKVIMLQCYVVVSML